MDNPSIPDCAMEMRRALSSEVRRRAEGFPGQRLVVLPPAALARARALPFSTSMLPSHIGRFDRAEGHYVERPHGCPEHVLLVCVQGQGFVACGGRTTPLSEGMAILLPPRLAHRYGASAERPWSLFWMHLVGAHATRLAELFSRSTGKDAVSFHFEGTDRIVEAFEDAYRHVRGAFSDSDLVGLSTAAGRCIGLLRELRRAEPGVKREAEERVHRAIRHMRVHLDRTIPLSELAAVAGWSLAHFATVFRNHTQAPPLLYLTRLRVQRACELLKASDAPLREVAQRCGFSDPFYFSRAFTRHQGLSPRAYRERYARPHPRGAGAGRRPPR